VEHFIKHFRRDPFGVWICVAPAEVQLPQGRIQVTVGSRFARGTKFMNLDLAVLLEEHHEKQQGGHAG
jgi:hypothetical protein